MSTLQPFHINIPQADLDDLAGRLTRTRWPDELPGAAWASGVAMGRVREVAAYWFQGYDWRAWETRLNAVPQFTTVIDGQQVHFLHVRGGGELPLLLCHGWPSTPADFLDLVGPLAGAGFDLVIPSMPGYGFSGPTTSPGWDVARSHDLSVVWFDELVGDVTITRGVLVMRNMPTPDQTEIVSRIMTAVLAAGFLFNAAGVQHSALLQRQMRFTALAVINVVSLIVGTAIAIAGAEAGYGYWALVAMTVTLPLISTIGFWLTTGWLPGAPRRRTGIRSMMRFGGTLTLNGLVAYVAYNAEKIMIGRFWGADAIGIYGRAYQLVNIPTENLNSAVGEVAFSASTSS